MRVLFADGDEGSLKVAQRYLWHCGHEAKVASNGLECVDILRREEPDVVVLGREMLWGGGDGVLAVMQQDHEWSRIPVILTSGDVLPEESGSVASPRLVAQLQKPYRIEDLLALLETSSVNGEQESEAECPSNQQPQPHEETL